MKNQSRPPLEFGDSAGGDLLPGKPALWWLRGASDSENTSPPSFLPPSIPPALPPSAPLLQSHGGKNLKKKNVSARRQQNAVIRYAVLFAPLSPAALTVDPPCVSFTAEANVYGATESL